MNPKNKKILVIRFSSLGDLVLTTPVYRNLKNFDSNIFVAVATKQQFAQVLQGHACIDEVFALQKGESIWHFARRLNRENFDIILDLHGSLRSIFLSFLLRAKCKLRYKKASWQRRFFVARKIKFPELEQHTIERYLAPLNQLGIKPQLQAPEIFSDTPKPSNKRTRFLVIQTAFLGDAVLTLPLLSAIKQFYPLSHLTVLATPEIKEIFSGRKEIDTLLINDKRGKDKGVKALWNWSQKIKNHDVALVAHRSFRSGLLAFLSGIPQRIGFSNSQGKIFLTDSVPFYWTQHDSERNLKLLEPLGIAQLKPNLNLEVHSNRVELLTQHQIDPKRLIVGMNPSSVWKTKRWIPEHFAQVADTLIKEYNCQVVLFGSSKDKQAVDEVLSFAKESLINLCEKTNLKTLIALISQCDLFITNDSGPMHLATASNVPVVAIFGPTTKELGFFPYGKKSVVVDLPLECRPCSLHGGNTCPLTHFKCMRDITPQMVLPSCRSFLNAVQK